MNEKTFMTFLTDACNLTLATYYHTYDSRRSHRGFPDLVVITRSHRLIFAEAKTTTGRITQDQRHWLTTLAATGQATLVIRPGMENLWLSLLLGEPTHYPTLDWSTPYPAGFVYTNETLHAIHRSGV